MLYQTKSEMEELKDICSKQVTCCSVLMHCEKKTNSFSRPGTCNALPNKVGNGRIERHLR